MAPFGGPRLFREPTGQRIMDLCDMQIVNGRALADGVLDRKLSGKDASRLGPRTEPNQFNGGAEQHAD